jgi:hypothetical protein
MQNGFWNKVSSKVLLLLLVSFTVMVPLAQAGGDVTSSVDMKFWGRAIFNTHYDTGSMATEFMSYLNDDDTESWNFNPRDTRLGFSAGHEQGDWGYRAVFEMDFYGANNGNSLLPRLRLGYAEAKNNTNGLSIRGGQDWTPVAQQNPGTLDFGVMSWGGNLWWRVPQLTVRYKPNNVEFLVSAMKHRVSNDQERQEKMPWMLGRVGVDNLVVDGSLIALGGGVRSVTFSDNDPDVADIKYSPYMMAIEFKVPFGDSGIKLNGEFYMGKGVGREWVHYGFDYNPTHPDGSTEVESQGGFASLKVPASAKLEFNAGVGMDDPKDDSLKGMSYEDIRYLKNQTVFLNFKHKITPKFGWGLEFVNFNTTKAMDDADERATADLKGQRFTTSMWFVF